MAGVSDGEWSAEGETFATALGRIYTSGPSFRAENSNTTRLAAEFWMGATSADFNDRYQ